MTDNKYFLLVAINQSQFRVGIGDASGQIHFRKQATTPLRNRARAATLQILNFCDQFITESGFKPSQLAKIAVSIDSPVDFEAQKIIASREVEGWENFPLAQHLSDQFHLPAVIDELVNTTTLAESRFGKHSGTRNFFYVNADNTIGGAIVLEGSLWRGHNFQAGNIGHMIVKPDGKLCRCGKRGCLEMYSSVLAIVSSAINEIDINPYETNNLVDLVNGRVMSITAETVFLAAKQGDRLSKKYLDEAARYLAVAITNVLNLLDLEKVLVGGGLIFGGDQFFTPLQSRLEEYTDQTIPIERINFSEDSGLIGGIALALS